MSSAKESSSAAASQHVTETSNIDKQPMRNQGRKLPIAAPPENTHTFPSIANALSKSPCTVDTVNILMVKYDDISWYFPCCIMLFELLFQMDQSINNSESLLHTPTNSFSLHVRIYYSVLFYAQILQAIPIGLLIHDQKSWLKLFSTKFSGASIPMAGPLASYFCTICACLSENSSARHIQRPYHPWRTGH